MSVVAVALVVVGLVFARRILRSMLSGGGLTLAAGGRHQHREEPDAPASS
jgi:hypothetical protein